MKINVFSSKFDELLNHVNSINNHIGKLVNALIDCNSINCMNSVLGNCILATVVKHKNLYCTQEITPDSEKIKEDEDTEFLIRKMNPGKDITQDILVETGKSIAEGIISSGRRLTQRDKSRFDFIDKWREKLKKEGSSSNDSGQEEPKTFKDCLKEEFTHLSSKIIEWIKTISEKIKNPFEICKNVKGRVKRAMIPVNVVIYRVMQSKPSHEIISSIISISKEAYSRYNRKDSYLEGQINEVKTEFEKFLDEHKAA